jgi:hypothetical protein
MAKTPAKGGSSGKGGGRGRKPPSPPINPRSGKPYSEAYWKRLKLAEAKGLSRQAARGHKPKGGTSEYARRVERETAKYGVSPAERRRRLTAEQRQEIRQFAQKRARARGKHTDRNAFVPGMERYAAQHGFEVFQDMASGIDFGPGEGVTSFEMWEAFEEYDANPLWGLYEEAA